jgi:nicotinamide-nucleotide amidase
MATGLMATRSDRHPLAVLLTIGDELLVGDRADTNARWLAEGLTAASFRVVEILSVGDDESEIREALLRADARAPGGLLVVTGGLGPTLDDRTREAAAAHLGLDLEEDPAVLEVLTARFLARGYAELPPLNRRIARVPRGAHVLPNPVGSAPGLELPPHRGGARVFLLPGVPDEMKAIFSGAVLERLDMHFPERPAPPVVEIVRTTGIPESRLARELEVRMAEIPGVSLQYRPAIEGVELRFSAQGPGASERLAMALAAVETVIAPWRYGGRGSTLEGAVLAACRVAGWKLAVAESCTGGMVGARLTSIPGSSDVVLGGVVAYHNRVKTDLLGVPEELLALHGAVSAPVAEAMASGVRRKLGADAAVSITGVAGPGGGSEHRPVGTVWFGLDHAGADVRSRHVVFPGTRDEIRRRASQYALQWVRREALREAGDPDAASHTADTGGRASGNPGPGGRPPGHG